MGIYVKNKISFLIDFLFFVGEKIKLVVIILIKIKSPNLINV